MLNHHRLQKLEEDLSPQTFAEFLATFFQEADAALCRLATSEGPAQHAVDLHLLKDNALTFGLEALGQFCHSVSLHSGDRPITSADLKTLTLLYQTGRSELLSYSEALLSTRKPQIRSEFPPETRHA